MPGKERWRIGGALALLCALAYLPALLALLRGASPFAGDSLSAFGPWREFTRAAVWRGVLPLWNPHVFCGMPFLANGQSAVLYPPNTLYLLLPVSWALLLDAYLHNVLLACGGYALARALGMSRTAALLTAILLALGGAVSARVYAGHMTWHAARAYLPWLLWATLLFLRHGRLRHAIALAVLAALLLAVGHPMIAALGGALSLGLTLAYLATHRGQWRAVAWPKMVPALVLLAALGAVSLLPLQEAGQFAVRHKGLPYSFAVIGSGSWRSFVRLLLPDFFGGNVNPQWSMIFFPYEEAAALGIVPALLALGAPLLARRGGKLPRAVPWLWGLMLLAATLALGDKTGVYRWAFEHLPLFKAVRVPVRWLELWFFTAALLAGFSFDGCRPLKNAALILNVALALIAVIFFCLESWLMSGDPSSPLWMKDAQWTLQRAPQAAQEAAAQLRWAAIFAALLGGVIAAGAAFIVWRWRLAATGARRGWERALLALMVAELLFLFWRSARHVEPGQLQAYVNWPPQIVAASAPGQRWDTDFRGPWADYAWNSGLAPGVDLFNGYDPFGPLRYFDFADAMERERFVSYQYQPQRRSALLRVAGVTHTLSAPALEGAPPPVTTFGTPAQERSFEAWALWKHSGAWPRVYLTNRVERLPESAQLARLETLAQGDFAAQHQPVVAAPGAFNQVQNEGAPGRVIHWTRDLNRFDIDVETAMLAVLVIGENNYVGWRAFVTTETGVTEAPIEYANYLFRGVALPKGARHVTLVYETSTLRLALFLSLAGLGTLAALLSFYLFTTRKAAK